MTGGKCREVLLKVVIHLSVSLKEVLPGVMEEGTAGILISFYFLFCLSYWDVLNGVLWEIFRSPLRRRSRSPVRRRSRSRSRSVKRRRSRSGSPRRRKSRSASPIRRRRSRSRSIQRRRSPRRSPVRSHRRPSRYFHFNHIFSYFTLFCNENCLETNLVEDQSVVVPEALLED